jgi:hypothetical protein
MRTLSVLSFALTIALAGAAGAQTATPDAAAAAPAPAAPQKMICVRGEAETGSHFGASKVCHTESEWTMIHNQSNRMLERYDIQNNQMTPGSGR